MTTYSERVSGVLIALGLAGLCAATHAADIKFVTEYRYPTSYEVTPVTVAGPNGSTTISGGIVVPRDFETREVGVAMSVHATAGDLASHGGILPTFEQKALHGNTDLMLAATSGDAETVRRLIRRRGAVNAKNKYGSTALMGAAAGGFVDVVDALLKGGASTDMRSKNGSTALMFASRNGHRETVEKLLAAGAKVNLWDRNGATALMYAVEGEHARVAALLIQKGADVNKRNLEGTTPLMIASSRKQSDLVVLLTRFGARR